MDSVKKYEELKESGQLPQEKTALSCEEKSLINRLTKPNHIWTTDSTCDSNVELRYKS